MLAKTKGDKADASRERILDAAANLFREGGYASVSLRSIAGAAGMKAGSVYYHFDSKEEIVVEVLNLGIEMVHNGVEQAINKMGRSAKPAVIIRAGVGAHLRALHEFSDYTSANVRIFGQVPKEVQKANLAVRRGYEALWENILANAELEDVVQPGVNLRAFRLLLIGSLNATLEWFDPAQGTVERLAEDYTQILLQGLLKKENAP